ncbi:MAG TPA: response regulator, partial [Verrucomicrobiae bacterium]|nr:response regulator [Verrucomicrobiae bacterium]
AASDEVQRSLRLEAFYRKVHFVTASAGLTGCQRIGKMSSVLEALLFVLIDKPAQLNPMVLRTISTALDLIEALFQNADRAADEPVVDPQILVVDDDPLSNRLEVMALRRAELHAFGVENPVAALQRLETIHYDLILLDVEMPGLDGFEFCRRVRGLPKYQRTPIIYVTSHTDLETRTEGLLSGGNDVITKPIFPMELAVKAITHLLKTQIPQ